MSTHVRSMEERPENAEKVRKRGIDEMEEEKEKRNAHKEIYC